MQAGDRFCGTSSERGMKLGMDLLTAIFATHPPACVEILNTCQAKLIGASEAQSLPYLCVLGRLIRDYPGMIASHLPCLKVSPDPAHMCHCKHGMSHRSGAKAPQMYDLLNLHRGPPRAAGMLTL